MVLSTILFIHSFQRWVKKYSHQLLELSSLWLAVNHIGYLGTNHWYIEWRDNFCLKQKCLSMKKRLHPAESYYRISPKSPLIKICSSTKELVYKKNSFWIIIQHTANSLVLKQLQITFHWSAKQANSFNNFIWHAMALMILIPLPQEILLYS